MTSRSGHASTYAPDPASTAPQQRMEQVIGYLVDRANADHARVLFRRPFDTLEATFTIVGVKV